MQGEEFIATSGLRSRLAAFITLGLVCIYLLSLSGVTAWARGGIGVNSIGGSPRNKAPVETGSRGFLSSALP
jgi:hypothetical protein